MRANDVMTTHVVGIEPHATTRQAFDLMERAKISGLPVLDPAGVPLGIVTRSDLMRSGVLRSGDDAKRIFRFIPGLEKIARQSGYSPGKTVQDVMTRKLISVTEETPLSEIVALLNRHRIKRVPVMHAGKIVGIVSRGDLLHALAWVFGAPESQDILDADIKSRIMAQLESAGMSMPAPIEIAVRNAEVALRGTLANKRLRDAIRLTIANTPGVVAIHDHLSRPEPDMKAAVHLQDAPERRAG